MNKIILNIIVMSILIAILMIAAPCFGGDEVIYGCVGKITGNLRVVSSTSKCLPLEKPISWNKQGLPGVANGITAAAYAYVNSDGSFVPAIPPSEAVLRVDHPSDGNYLLSLDPDVFSLTYQPRCIVNAVTINNVRCAQFGGTAAQAQIYCVDTNDTATDVPFSVICVQ